MFQGASDYRRRNHDGSPAGFTLAELLIVIAIIAVLISILLPTLGAARRAANSSKCLASLRDLGLAFQQYAQDNKRAFPVVEWSPPAGFVTDGIPNRTWQYFLVKYIHKRNVDSTFSLDQIKTASTLWGCPEFNGDSFFKSGVLPGTTAVDYTIPNQFNTGYGMNRFALAPMLPAGTAPANNPNGFPLTANGTSMTDLGNVALVRNASVFGQFFKMETWSKHGAEKCLLADCNHYDLYSSSKWVAADSVGLTPSNNKRCPPFVQSAGGVD